MQPPNLNPTRKNIEAITKILKSPLNELWPIWPLDILWSLEELVELKKIKQQHYLWKKCFGKDNEHVSEWNTWARKFVRQWNQCKIERFIKAWFKLNTRKFNGKTISEKQEKTQFASNFVGPSRWRDVYEQRVDIENNGEESSDSGDNGFETTIHASKGAFEPRNSCFGGQKWRDNWHCEVNDLQPKDF